MNNSFSREEILNRIRKVDVGSQRESSIPDMGKSIYKDVAPSLLDCFKNELELVSGHCLISKSEKELANILRQILEENKATSVFCKEKKIGRILEKYSIPFSSEEANFQSMQIGVASCESLIARTASVLVTSNTESGRQLNIFPPIHIVLATKNQLLESIEEGLIAVKEKYGERMPSLVSFISGPSRTADIEKTLVLGAHGPKELYVIISE